jgi:uncharacterized membrane protein YeiB
MEQEPKAPPAGPLAPVLPTQRIQALDVVRGFALIGVLLMNIEFFNRNTRGIEEGMQVGLTGLDWAASWFIAYFVQGKFWTIFSLLFGMGFALLLTRAERAQSDFLGPYLRRIGALAVIGAAHYVFLWDGDILFSYAMGAGALLILLYGRWRHLLLTLFPVSGLALIPGFSPVWGIAAALVSMGLFSLYLRSERRVTIRGRSLPLFSFLVLVLGTVALMAAMVLWSLPAAPKEPRVPITIASIGMLVVALLAAKFGDPVELRGLRLGVGVYVFAALMMTSIGAVQYLTPRDPVSAAGAARAAQGDTRSSHKSASTEAQKAAERAKRLAKQQQEDRHEVRILSQGRYLDAVETRALKFPVKVTSDAGFSTVLIALFLLGVWFVRSGVMENTRAHLALFRKLALAGLPVGIGLGLLGSLIAISKTPGDEHDGFLMARGLAVLGNLPACLGYVGMVVWMLHSRSAFGKIRVLAPFGRMALTNYLMQSVICTLCFYGYGLGHWGLARAWQVVFAVLLLAMQIAFSHWWLARYRFGPIEWLWRGFTYRQTPPMRL